MLQVYDAIWRHDPTVGHHTMRGTGVRSPMLIDVVTPHGVYQTSITAADEVVRGQGQCSDCVRTEATVPLLREEAGQCVRRNLCKHCSTNYHEADWYNSNAVNFAYQHYRPGSSAYGNGGTPEYRDKVRRIYEACNLLHSEECHV